MIEGIILTDIANDIAPSTASGTRYRKENGNAEIMVIVVAKACLQK
jgi:hypothetical protein